MKKIAQYPITVKSINQTKNYKAIIHGVPKDITEKQILNETKNQNVTEVKRMGYTTKKMKQLS